MDVNISLAFTLDLPITTAPTLLRFLFVYFQDYYYFDDYD